MGLSTALKLAKLQVITDLHGPADQFADWVRLLIAGGVDLVQVRDTKASEHDLDRAFKAAREVALPRHVLLVAGRDLGLARRVQADVAHLGSTDGATSAGRAAVQQFGLVGRSVHTEEQLRDALADPDIAYLMVGPVYGDVGTGLDLVRAAASLSPQSQPTSKPWFAVGGITRDNLREVLDAGALRVTVSGALVEADDAEQAARGFADALQAAWEHTPGMDRVRTAAFRMGDEGDAAQAPPFTANDDVSRQ